MGGLTGIIDDITIGGLEVEGTEGAEPPPPPPLLPPLSVALLAALDCATATPMMMARMIAAISPITNHI